MAEYGEIIAKARDRIAKALDKADDPVSRWARLAEAGWQAYGGKTTVPKVLGAHEAKDLKETTNFLGLLQQFRADQRAGERMEIEQERLGLSKETSALNREKFEADQKHRALKLKLEQAKIVASRGQRAERIEAEAYRRVHEIWKDKIKPEHLPQFMLNLEARMRAVKGAADYRLMSMQAARAAEMMPKDAFKGGAKDMTPYQRETLDLRRKQLGETSALRKATQKSTEAYRKATLGVSVEGLRLRQEEARRKREAERRAASGLDSKTVREINSQNREIDNLLTASEALKEAARNLGGEGAIGEKMLKDPTGVGRRIISLLGGKPKQITDDRQLVRLFRERLIAALAKSGRIPVQEQQRIINLLPSEGIWESPERAKDVLDAVLSALTRVREDNRRFLTGGEEKKEYEFDEKGNPIK